MGYDFFFSIVFVAFIPGKSQQNFPSSSPSAPPPYFHSSTLIRPEEFENHNKDGGLWLIIDGKVYDIQDFKYKFNSNSWFSKYDFNVDVFLKKYCSLR